jgi:O-antigen chain-terminating methyltransferase
MTENSFYRAFEDRHRGSRELIKSRLNVYKKFIEPLLVIEKNPSAIDLGCGRGEWLEVLGEIGVIAIGVDLDKGMLAACAEKRLTGVHGDAIEYLSSLGDESQLVVSAFHFVEHISFEGLQRLTKEAHRVLKPGGLLIMETPNPENIFVATCNFYLDPTHIKPIPPDLLVFIAKYCGFSRANIVRLQESKEVLQSQALTLNDVLGGASPDYAVVAQRAAKTEIYSLCDEVFGREFGINSINLAARYSDQLEAKIERIRIRAQEASIRAQEASIRAQEASIRAQEAVDGVVQANLVIQSIYASYSWRVTGPLRWVGSQVRKLRQEGFTARLKSLVKKVFVNIPGLSSVFRDKENKTRKAMISVSRRIGMYAFLRKYYVLMGGKPNSPHSADLTYKQAVSSLDDLSPNAKKIYFRLTEERSSPEDKV